MIVGGETVRPLSLTYLEKPQVLIGSGGGDASGSELDPKGGAAGPHQDRRGDGLRNRRANQVP